MLIIFLFSPISANSTSTAKIWPKIIFFAELIKILSESKKKRLKSVQVRSLRKIVHVFVIFITKSEFRFWPLPLKMNSTVGAEYAPDRENAAEIPMGGTPFCQ